MKKEERKFRRGILGMRILAVLAMTAISLVLTLALILGWISTNTFVLIFVAWYAVTVMFMLITGGLPITEKEDAERRTENNANNGSSREQRTYTRSGRDSKETR